MHHRRPRAGPAPLLCLLACAPPEPAATDATATSTSAGSGSGPISGPSTHTTSSGESTAGGETTGELCALDDGALWGALYPATAVGVDARCPAENTVSGRVIAGVVIDEGAIWVIEECACGQDCPDAERSRLALTSTSALVDPSLIALPTCVKVESKNLCLACVDAGGECLLESVVVWDLEAPKAPFLVAFSADASALPASVAGLFGAALVDGAGCSGADCSPTQELRVDFTGFDQPVALASGTTAELSLHVDGETYPYELRNLRSYRIAPRCDDAWTAGDERVDWLLLGRW